MLTLTATNLPRFMACNGSLQMGESEVIVEQDNIVRDEGIAAHWFIQQVHDGKFAAEELIDRKAPNGVYITADMVDYAEEYLNDIKNAEVEVDTSYNGNNWQINGRTDAVGYSPTTKILTVSDYKYGWRIVEPKMNWTLISHAIGYSLAHTDNEIKTFTFKIYQPRPYHPAGRVREWSVTNEELNKLYDQLIHTLQEPSDQLCTSQHCHNCPALAICPSARRAMLNAVDISEGVYDERIDNQTLSFELDNIDRALGVLKERRKAYEELSIARIKEGQMIDNYAVDKSLTNRQFKKGITPEYIQMLTGLDIAQRKLPTPAQAEKMGLSKEVVETLVERREKGLKLVRVSANDKASKLLNK